MRNASVHTNNADKILSYSQHLVLRNIIFYQIQDLIGHILDWCELTTE